MTNFEKTIPQEQLDEQVVADALAEIEEHLRTGSDTAWAEKYFDAGAYIDKLYDEFVPEADERVRMTGKIIGAAGLALAEVRYGHDEYSPKLYGGSYEDRILATYHHGGHPRMFIRNMFKYAAKVNEVEPDTYGDDAFARFPGIGAFHDLVMGNGRGNDERQSALLAASFMTDLGFTLVDDEPTVAGVLATTWDADNNAQAVNAEQPFVEYQRVAAVADLLSVFEKSGPYQGLCVVIEDMCKRMNNRLFVVEADAAGFSLNDVSIEDCMRFVDSNPAVRARFTEMLAGQAGFFANFTPADPRLDEMFPGRAENVQFMVELNEHYAAGTMSAVDVLHAARDFMNQ